MGDMKVMTTTMIATMMMVQVNMAIGQAVCVCAEINWNDGG